MKVSCLGPEGSFSECAARRMLEGCEVTLCHNFSEAVEKVTAGEADCAVLPVENALNGGVISCLDLLESEEVFGTEEMLLPIDLRLATLEGVRREDIRAVYSHEQALGQCSEYLKRVYPLADYFLTSSTSESLNRLDKNSAGIVGAHIKREGIVLSEENLADNKANFTRFIRVERRGKLPEHSVMVLFCAVCAHKPGSLVGLLKIFLRYSINLTRIQSRPVKEEFGQYRFFIEVAGDIGNDRVKKALAEARAYCLEFKLLGAYL